MEEVFFMSVKGLKGHIKFLHCKWIQINKATDIWKLCHLKKKAFSQPTPSSDCATLEPQASIPKARILSLPRAAQRHGKRTLA